MEQLLRVQNFTVSRDGSGAGEHQSLERPFGDADPGELFAWAGATASWPHRTDPAGSRGLDDYFTRDFAHNIGAEIMGRNKFGPRRGPWADHDWRGEIGSGVRLWESPEELLDRFHLDVVPSPSGVTHHLFWRR
ncbi:hypothetical protein [Streptomyces sp. NPDC090036]|uniref:hypothetical protein n=1 Tax=Streptomyces sp. NPDC090036 TaxID=3365926 RepID=UPI0038048A23